MEEKKKIGIIGNAGTGKSLAYELAKNKCGLPIVVNNEAVSFTDHSDELRCSEMAFCASPFHDFDNCPLIKQTNDCKNCRWYNDGTK